MRLIQSAFPDANRTATTVSITETLHDFQTAYGSIEDLAREVVPTLTGLKLQELEKLGYALIEDDTARTLVLVPPREPCSGLRSFWIDLVDLHFRQKVVPEVNRNSTGWQLHRKPQIDGDGRLEWRLSLSVEAPGANGSQPSRTRLPSPKHGEECLLEESAIRTRVAAWTGLKAPRTTRHWAQTRTVASAARHELWRIKSWRQDGY